MIAFIRKNTSLFSIIAIWLLTMAIGGPLLYVVLPISVFLMRRSELWPDILFGFIVCLVISDMDPTILVADVMKTAKNTYMIAISLVFISDQMRFKPHAKVFNIFVPFYLFSILCIIRSPVPFDSIQKTISYALLFLVIPNYVLFNYRRIGWDFFKNLTYFIVLILVAQLLLPYLAPDWWAYREDRYRGFFGNPNGLAIFCLMGFLLFSVVNVLKKDLFTTTEKVLIYGVMVYFVVLSGARTSLMAMIMFIFFIQFFRISPYLGLISFIGFITGFELVSNNLPAIVSALGLGEYLRVDTLEDGSGRYIAWNFAWGKINDGYFLFGGGFANDEYIMRVNYKMLSMMGHQGGVHNSYLTLWLNTGLIGLLLFLRSFFLVFIKAGKRTSVAYAVLFSVLFSAMYENWLTASLNPFTIILVVILTMMSEDEIVLWEDHQTDGSLETDHEAEEGPPALILPAR